MGMSGTRLSTNAPPAILHPVGKRWLVDISVAAAPGPGPVWCHEEFESAREAVKAIEECFFAHRVNEPWYGAEGRNESDTKM